MRISPKNPIKGQTNNRGFTLVEFLVSLTLVTLLLTGTVQLTIYSLLVKRNADLNLKITEHASSLFEHFKSFPYESEELKEGLVAETIKEEGSFETFIRKWKIEEISPHLKEIELEVTSEKYSQKKIRLVLYISRELGF
jgi:prepilin-type N-terminal cleavage/methylation domain-containing protein